MATKAAGAPKTARKGTSGTRELIDTGRNKMFAKRGAAGRFTEMDDVGRSLTADRRRTAKTKVKSGRGDKGDRQRRLDSSLPLRHSSAIRYRIPISD